MKICVKNAQGMSNYKNEKIRIKRQRSTIEMTIKIETPASSMWAPLCR